MCVLLPTLLLAQLPIGPVPYWPTFLLAQLPIGPAAYWPPTPYMLLSV